jgi:ADP-ribose pyrophosphatase YjhB (NUDIX family)
MAKSSKLIVAKRGKVLLVRRRRDRLWMFPGGRKRAGESERKCLRREIREELPKLKLGPLKLWKELKGKNRRSGRKMSDAIFLTKKASGQLKIGDKREIDKALWCKPRGIRLTPTSRYLRDKLFPR